MEFDKSKVYTALNADELKVGSKVICAFTMFQLKERVNKGEEITEVNGIRAVDCEHRIYVYAGDGESCFSYPLAYLVAEPEEKKLKWTDLKVGDVVRHKDYGVEYLITGFDEQQSKEKHIRFGDGWVSDNDLESWEKVE